MIAQWPNGLEVAGEQVCLVLPDEFSSEECGHILEYSVVVLFAIAENAFAFVEIYQRLTVTVSVQCLKCEGLVFR